MNWEISPSSKRYWALAVSPFIVPSHNEQGATATHENVFCCSITLSCWSARLSDFLWPRASFLFRWSAVSFRLISSVVGYSSRIERSPFAILGDRPSEENQCWLVVFLFFLKLTLWERAPWSRFTRRHWLQAVNKLVLELFCTCRIAAAIAPIVFVYFPW